MDPRTVQKNYQKAKDDTKEWRTEARELYDLVAGKQWTSAEEGELKENKRLPIVMNRIAPFLDAIAGQQVNNRKDVRYLPRETSDTNLADLYTEAGRWADDMCAGQDEVSDSFFDMLVCGMGWTETRMDYSEDPEGRLITAERIDPLEMYWETSDTSRNLSKSNWVIRARKFPKDEAEDMWPKLKTGVVEWAADESEMRHPHDATNAWKYENDTSPFNPNEQTYLILQCQYTQDMPIYRVADPDSGKIVTLDTKRFTAMKDVLDQMGVKYVKTTQRKYYQCFVCGETELEKEEGPSQRGFTLKCMTGKRDRNAKVWYGMTRALKDPQKFSNKFFSDIMYILATNRKGGAFVEVDALADPRKAEDQWADPAALIRLNPGALAAGKIRERDAGVYPTGLDRLMQYAIDAVPATSGLNPEMIGMADRAQPGILEAQRKQSALTIVAPLFDALTRHQRARGVVCLDFLHRFIADGRAIRITNPEGQQQAVPFNPAPDAPLYDIIVDEMPSTPNSKSETFQVLAELVPFMAKMGISPPPDTLDYLPLPATLVEKWKQSLQNQQQQGPSPEEQQAQMEMQAKQAESQAKMQIEIARMQHEREMAAQQAQQAAQEQEIDRQRMQMDANLKMQESQLKAAELEFKRMELAAKMRQAEQQNVEAKASTDAISNGLSGISDQMVQAMAHIGESHAKTADSVSGLAEMMLKAMKAPREVVRDAKGRATGTRVVID